MADFIIEYVLTQVRVVRLTANTMSEAQKEIKNWHEQHNSERINESVIIYKCDKDE